MGLSRAIYICIGVILLCVGANATAAGSTVQQITSLPGWNGTLPTMYSGYIQVDPAHERKLFYWLVESNENPTEKPLLLWLQGGPGCSGLIGLFMENGPIQVTPLDSTGTNFAPEWNPFSWPTFANVLYIEAPVGVGFSFSMNSSDYNTDNNKTSEDNYVLLQNFIALFPRYQGRPLWIAGESYGGDYVPQLAQRILQGTDLGLKNALQGLAIGNPVFSCPAWKRAGNSIQIELFFWHALIPLSSYVEWKNSGCDVPIASATRQSDGRMMPPPHRRSSDVDCNGLANNISLLTGNIDPDNLYTDLLTGNASLGIGPVWNQTIQGWIQDYLSSASVQNAIGVPNTGVNKTIHRIMQAPRPWGACCAEPGQSGMPCKLNYTNYWSDMTPIYDYFFTEAPQLKILIYSGDTDIATCPHPYAQLCLMDMQRPLQRGWTPWVIAGQTAGYVEVYDKYTYATVKGAGHEVPMFQPWAAHSLVSSFIAGQFP